MADFNGQKPAKWKSFNGKKQSAALNSSLKRTSKKYQEVLNSCAWLINGYSADLYGNANDTKYIYIVDLIIKRLNELFNDDLTSVIQDSMNNFIENLKSSIELKTSDIEVDKLGEKIYKTISNQYNSKFKSFKKEVKSIFKEYKKSQKSESKTNIEKTKKDSKDQLENIIKDINDEFSNIYDSIDFYFYKIIEFTNEISKYSDQSIKLIDSNIQSLNYLLKKIKSIQQNQKINNAQKNIDNAITEITPTKKDKKAQNELRNQMDIFDKLKFSKQIFYKRIENKIEKSFNSFIFEIAKIMVKHFIIWFPLIFAQLIIAAYLFIDLIIKPICELIAPILKLVKNIVQIVTHFIKSITLDSVIELILTTILQPFAKFFNGIADGLIIIILAIKDSIADIFETADRLFRGPFVVLTNFFNGFSTNAKLLGKLFGDLVQIVLHKLEILLTAIADNGEKISKALVRYMDTIIEIFIELINGFGSNAEEIGSKIAELCISFLSIVEQFFEAWKDKAEEIGRKFVYIKVSFIDHSTELFDMVGVFTDQISNCVQYVVDYFEGLGSNAYEVGKINGKYKVEEWKFRINYMRAFKDKAQYVGNYIATKMRNDFLSINKYLQFLKVSLGIEDAMLPDDYEILRKIKDKVLNIKDLIEEILPNGWFYNNDPIKYIDAMGDTFPDILDEICKDIKEINSELKKPFSGIDTNQFKNLGNLEIILKNKILIIPEKLNNIGDIIDIEKANDDENKRIDTIEKLIISLSNELKKKLSALNDIQNENKEPLDNDKIQNSILKSGQNIVEFLKNMVSTTDDFDKIIQTMLDTTKSTYDLLLKTPSGENTQTVVVVGNES